METKPETVGSGSPPHKVRFTIVDDSDYSHTDVSPTLEETPVATVAESSSTSPVPVSNATIEATSSQAIIHQILDYVMQNTPKLYILTPCYGGQCSVNYIQSMLATIELFRTYQFPVRFEFCKSDSLVPRARNNLIAKAMSDPEMTHMMFIDSDIMWNPVDILRMVLADKALIGGIYPLKKYDWNRIIQDPANPYNSNVVQTLLAKKRKSTLKEFLTDEAYLQAYLLKYNVNYLTNYLSIDNNIARVRHIPTGFMLIQRATIAEMFKTFSHTKYVDDVHFLTDQENEFAFALFDCGVIEGHYFSEDWMFCERWSQMGGEVWADVSVNLTHSGMEDYRGSYIASML